MGTLELLFSALFLNKNSMLGHKNCSCPKKKKKCHWSQSTLATCAAVNEPTFSDNKHFHRKIPPQFSMMSTNLFLLRVPRAAPRVRNTQTVAGKTAATLGLVHGSNLALCYWYVSVTLPALLICTSGEPTRGSSNCSNSTWISSISRSDQTEGARISGDIFLHIVSFSLCLLIFLWFIFIYLFSQGGFLMRPPRHWPQTAKKLPWYGPLIWMWKMTSGRALPLLTLLNWTSQVL